MSAELTNKHTARGFSVLYQMFARKQCIICSALRNGCLTLLYVASIQDFFCPWNNRARCYQAAASQPRFFARLLVGNYFILFYFYCELQQKRLDQKRHFPYLTRTFYIQFSFSFKSRKASLRNLNPNQFTLAFQSFLLLFFLNTTVLETIVRNALPENHFLE